MAKQQNTIYLSINKYVFRINNLETTFCHQLLQYRCVCCICLVSYSTYTKKPIKTTTQRKKNRLLIFKALLNWYLQFRYKQTVLLDQGKCSFSVNHPKTMGVKVAGTVKSHHTKKTKTKQNLVFDLNRLNKMKTAPILNGFFQQRCKTSKETKKHTV